VKIAHVTDCYLPRMGGIERQVEGLAAAQVLLGHDVEVITSVPGVSAHTVDAPVRVIRPNRSASRTGRIRYSSALAGRKAVLAGGYDLVHVHASTFSPMAYLAAGAASNSGIPTVATLHSLWSYATPIFRAADSALDWRRWPITWSAVSRVAAHSLEQVLRPDVEVSILPNGVSPDLWKVSRAPRAESPVVIVSVMRLAARKRPLHFLHTLRALRARVPADVRLEVRIVGDGPKREAMLAYLQRHRMTDWVELTGQLPQQSIRDVLADADLYVSPATLESFGIAALEARCSGLPVVGFAESGIADFIVHGRNGYLVRSDKEMVSALAQLVLNPTLRAAITQHNVRHESGLSWNSVLDSCEELYSRATGQLPSLAAGSARNAVERRTA
jgi:glycosyltransferase involved in cell wall biosynthesis